VTNKVKLAIGVGVLLVAGVAYARTRRPKLTCSGGAFFKPISKDSELYKNASAQTRAYVDKYGGYCARQGTVDFAGETGVITQPSQLEDAGPDNYGNGLITQPAQLG
jgi:hypothetical protein